MTHSFATRRSSDRSDQVIADVPAFHAAIAKGVRLAQQDWIVTFGITPDSPETGFGYIAAGEPLGGADGEGGFAVDRFVEKPTLEETEAMLEAGGYSWNAGILLFRAARLRARMPTGRGTVRASGGKAGQILVVQVSFK